MSNGSHKPVPRADSFEVIDADCSPILTDEEKSWPVVQLHPRVDGAEVTEVEVGDGTPSGVALKVTVASGATPEEALHIARNQSAEDSQAPDHEFAMLRTKKRATP